MTFSIQFNPVRSVILFLFICIAGVFKDIRAIQPLFLYSFLSVLSMTRTDLEVPF